MILQKPNSPPPSYAASLANCNTDQNNQSMELLSHIYNNELYVTGKI